MSSAIRELSTVELPRLAFAFAHAGVGGSQMSNTYYFNQTVNTRATTPTVAQDYQTMRALIGA